MSPSPEHLVEIYLADHLAAASAGVDLARRSAGSNEGTEFGAALARLAGEIADDRRTLERLVAALGLRASKAKNAVARAAEKAARLKLNGQVRGYSPLSRVLELESLSVGVAGKLALWEALRESGIGARSPGFDLEQLAERARRQRAEIEELRLRAVREAFAPR